MWTRFGILAAAALAMGGCGTPDGPTLIVSTSAPGLEAASVAEAVAAPLEQQINGVEGLARIESTSGPGGAYEARLVFRAGTDMDLTLKLVAARVNLASPILPEAARKAGIVVSNPPPVVKREIPATIAVEDRGDGGPEELRRVADQIAAKLEAGGAAPKPDLFPGPDEPRVVLRIDRDKLGALGVTEAAVREAVDAAKPDAPVEALAALTVATSNGRKVAVGDVARVERAAAPLVVLRIDLYPAIRISGPPPSGRSAVATAIEWAKSARVGLPARYEVIDLTPRPRGAWR